jgi:hypothetical protein
MEKLIAMATVIASFGCGSGSNEVAALRGEASPAVVVPGTCTGTPEDCGVKICVDCTGGSPPGTVAACVSGRCVFPCADGFHKCRTECVSVDDAGACGPKCTPCSAPPHATPVCAAALCDFACDPGFVRSASGCLSQSFSISY